jgi:hypothetical protein
MSNLFVMDSRVPVSSTADPNDPSNPTNVTKRAIMLERQAHADGEYDIKAPIRTNDAPVSSPTTGKDVTYKTQPNLMYSMGNDAILNNLPQPYPPGFAEAQNKYTKEPTDANAQALCSTVPTCKAVLMAGTAPNRRPFFYKNIGIQNAIGENGVLYTKMSAVNEIVPAATYKAEPNRIYFTSQDTMINMDAIPLPYPPGLSDAKNAFSKNPNVYEAQALCTTIPDCKAFAFNPVNKHIVLYKKISDQTYGEGGGVTLYTKTNAKEGFENPSVSPLLPLLHLLLPILIGSVLVGLLVCHKYNFYIKCAMGAGAIYAFHYAASLIPTT